MHLATQPCFAQQNENGRSENGPPVPTGNLCLESLIDQQRNRRNRNRHYGYRKDEHQPKSAWE